MEKRKEWRMVFFIVSVIWLLLRTSVTFAGMDVNGVQPIRKGSAGEAVWIKSPTQGIYSSWKKTGGFKVPAEYCNIIEPTGSTFYEAFGTTCSPQKITEAYLEDGYELTNMNPMTENAFFGFDIKKNTKGKCGIRARNLQLYDNEKREYVKLDCRITILDWEDETERSKLSHHIAIGKSARSAINTAGINESSLIWEYFLAGTDTPYNVKSNLTFDDIDAKQYIAFDADQVTNQFVSEDTNLSYKFASGLNLYFNPEVRDDVSRDPKNAMGAAYHTDSLRFTYGVDRKGTWCYFGYLNYAMFKPTPNDPAKFVSDSDEKEHKEVLLSNREETITYKVRQVVASGYAEETYLKNFLMEDTLEPCLQILSAKVQQDGKDCSLFDVDTRGQKVTAAAKASALNSTSFYNKTYDLVIEAKIKDGITDEELEQYTKGDVFTVENTGTVTIDDTPRNTDEVQVKTWEATADKTVSDADETKMKANTIPSRLEPFTYEVSVPVPAEVDTMSKLQLSDEVESCLEVQDVKVMADDADVSAYWSIRTAGNHVVAEANNPGPEFAGKTFKLRITAQGKPVSDETLQEHGHYNGDKSLLYFHNTGKLTYRLAEGKEVEHTTDRVTTTVRLPVDMGIEKTVDRYEHQVGDPIYYKATIGHHTADCDASDIVVRDTDLKDFELDVPNAKVSGVKKFKLVAIEGGWEFTTEKLAKDQTVTIDFTAKAKKVLNGTIPKNTATVKCFGVPQKADSEEIYVNSPKMKLTKKTERNAYQVGDTLDYELEISQINKGCFMRDVIFTDIIKTEGVNILPGSIIVLDKNGKDLTHTMDVTIKNNTFTIETKRNFSDSTESIPPKDRGKEPYDQVDLMGYLKICYSAKAAEESLSGMDVINTAQLPTRPNTNKEPIKDDPNIPSGGTEIEHQVPIKGAELRVTKESDKKTYEVGETALYTVKTEQIREDYTAKNVVLRDRFEVGGMEIVKDSIRVKHERKDITEDCKITTTENSYEIHTGEDLAYNETMTVTYKVVFTSDKLLGESVVNVAAADADNTKEKETENIVGLGDWQAGLKIQKDSDKTEYETGDMAHYTLLVSNEKDNAAEDVVIEDTVKTEGLELQPESIKVFYRSGASESEITRQCRTEADVRGFTIKTGRGLPKGNTIRVTYDVKIASKELAGKKGENIAIASGDNAPPAEDPHEVPILPLAVLEIEKKTDKDIYTILEDVKYTLKVTNTGQQTAKNVVIADSIVTKGLRLLADTITVKGPDGTDMTKKCDIQTEETGFKILTGKNLEKKETMTVTYGVKIEDEALAGKEFENMAAAAADNAEKKETADKSPVEPLTQVKIQKTAARELYRNGDVVNYKVVAEPVKKIAAKNSVIEDLTEGGGVFLKPDSIKINENGKDITANCKIQAKGNYFRIDTGRKLSYGNHYQITYKVKVKEHSGMLKNRVQIAGDNFHSAEADYIIGTEKSAAKGEKRMTERKVPPAQKEGTAAPETKKEGRAISTGDRSFLLVTVLVLTSLAIMMLAVFFRKRK